MATDAAVTVEALQLIQEEKDWIVAAAAYDAGRGIDLLGDVLFYHGIIPSFFTRKNWHERTTETASLQLSSESRLDSAQALVPPLTCKNT